MHYFRGSQLYFRAGHEELKRVQRHIAQGPDTHHFTIMFLSILKLNQGQNIRVGPMVIGVSHNIVYYKLLIVSYNRLAVREEQQPSSPHPQQKSDCGFWPNCQEKRG